SAAFDPERAAGDGNSHGSQVTVRGGVGGVAARRHKNTLRDRRASGALPSWPTVGRTVGAQFSCLDSPGTAQRVPRYANVSGGQQPAHTAAVLRVPSPD